MSDPGTPGSGTAQRPAYSYAMADHPIRCAPAWPARYQVEREIGEGGMATVYLVNDVRHARKAAMTVIPSGAA